MALFLRMESLIVFLITHVPAIGLIFLVFGIFSAFRTASDRGSMYGVYARVKTGNSSILICIFVCLVADSIVIAAVMRNSCSISGAIDCASDSAGNAADEIFIVVS